VEDENLNLKEGKLKEENLKEGKLKEEKYN
jgi:hypothetical protein